jgi:hypothetical protein
MVCVLCYAYMNAKMLFFSLSQAVLGIDIKLPGLLCPLARLSQLRPASRKTV